MSLELSWTVTSNRLTGEIQRGIRDAVSRAVMQSSERIVADASAHCPRDTGMTAESCRYEMVDDTTAVIIVDRFGVNPIVPSLLEYGYAHGPARPYLRPAVAKDQPQYIADMRDVLAQFGT
jgi:hypothetical protein